MRNFFFEKLPKNNFKKYTKQSLFYNPQETVTFQADPKATSNAIKANLMQM